jgi:anti-sigma factor ChrR (cupin superfamily)
LLSGDVSVGGYQLQPGDYSRADAGTVHEPICTEQGCVFIALAALDDGRLAAQD